MRVRFKPTREQRSALKAQLERLQQSAALLEILRPSLPDGFQPTEVTWTVPSRHPDRFVLRVEVRSNGSPKHAFALKVYSDDFVAKVWEHSERIAQHHRGSHSGMCLATQYLPHERMLVFPWVSGVFLSDVVDDRRSQLLREAAEVAAALHRTPVAPEHHTTAEMFVDETLARCGRLRDRWPETTGAIEPLMTMLEEAASVLDPTDPAPIHGDMAPGQFVWTGHRLVLLDLDMFGYADPAYDAGHFLAQMERRCLLDAALPVHAWEWLACFRDAYLAAMPDVSSRNVAFYRAITLIRKIYTVCRREPVEGPALIPPLAVHARLALKEAVAPQVAL